MTTHVTVDVVAWWSSSGVKGRMDLARRPLDTRSSARPLAGSTTVVPLSAVVPSDATVVLANLTAVAPSAAGSLGLSDCTASPDDPALRYANGENRAGLGVVSMSADLTVCLTTSASAHLLVDVMVTF